MGSYIKLAHRSSALGVLLLLACSCPGLVAAQPAVESLECPVTLPSESPVRGAPPSDGPGLSHAWYGSVRLAALIPEDGNWKGMGPEYNYRDKFWWWRSGYNAFREPMPNLIISATRLDGEAPEVEISNVTNAFGGNTHSMLTLMEFPLSGCWEVRATYNEVEDLVFVLRVGSM